MHVRALAAGPLLNAVRYPRHTLRTPPELSPACCPTRSQRSTSSLGVAVISGPASVHAPAVTAPSLALLGSADWALHAAAAREVARARNDRRSTFMPALVQPPCHSRQRPQ